MIHNNFLRECRKAFQRFVGGSPDWHGTTMLGIQASRAPRKSVGSQASKSRGQDASQPSDLGE